MQVEVRLRVIQYCKQMLGACAQASTAKVDTALALLTILTIVSYEYFIFEKMLVMLACHEEPGHFTYQIIPVHPHPVAGASQSHIHL